MAVLRSGFGTNSVIVLGEKWGQLSPSPDSVEGLRVCVGQTVDPAQCRRHANGSLRSLWHGAQPVPLSIHTTSRTLERPPGTTTSSRYSCIAWVGTHPFLNCKPHAPSPHLAVSLDKSARQNHFLLPMPSHLMSGYAPTGHRLSIRSSTNSASLIALSTQYSFAKFGLPDSMVSMSLRADRITAANKMACFRSSVMESPQFRIEMR